MIDLSFEINQFLFIVTTMRVKPHEYRCRQRNEQKCAFATQCIISFQVITCDKIKKSHRHIYIHRGNSKLAKLDYNKFLLLIRYISFKLYMIELWRNLGFICHKMFISLTCTTDCGFMFWYSCEMSTGPFLVLRSYNTLRSDDWSFKGKEEHDVFVGAKALVSKRKRRMCFILNENELYC